MAQETAPPPSLLSYLETLVSALLAFQRPNPVLQERLAMSGFNGEEVWTNGEIAWNLARTKKVEHAHLLVL